MSDVIYGCECVCENHAEGAEAAPVAWEVTRDGERVKLCTRCAFSYDKDKLPLFDKNTPSGPFLEFDALGAMIVALEVGNQVEA